MTEPAPDDAALLTASATALAAGLRAGRWTSRRLVEAHLARARAVNPALNAIVQWRDEAALAEADAADRRLAEARAAGVAATLPPLLGVPCTIKENFAFAGLPQVSGLVSRRHAIAGRDAPAVARLRAAGAIPLGTTNTPELCMWMETHNRVYGRTGNAYDPARIAGGSSGGEGAIVGSGASPFGLGADVGGSIRMPAFFNGVFGHKPTPGIVPNTGQFPLPMGAMNEHCVTGPIARRAEDLWPLLQILAGPDGIDPRCTADALHGDPAAVAVERLPVWTVAAIGRTPVAAALRAAQARAAEALGARPLPAHDGLVRAFDIWAAAMHDAGGTPFATMLGGDDGPVPLLREFARWGLRRSPHTLPALALAATEKLPLAHGRARRLGAELRARLIEQFGDDGVLLAPTYPRIAPRHGWPMALPFAFASCGLWNALGFPATQVPLGLDARGLPLGLQVVGPPGADARTVAVAGWLEQRFGGWVPPWSAGARAAGGGPETTLRSPRRS